MTHKQKADELVERFTKALTVNSWAVLKVDVIQCAIICVEEILKAEPSYPCPEGYYELHSDRTDEAKSIWQSVLNELKSRL